METFTVQETVLGQRFTFHTSPSVFSYHQIDKGSRFLLENTPIGQAKNILDLGCGYGAIGLVLARLNPYAKVSLVDENHQAIGLALENAQQNSVTNVKILRIDATRGLNLGLKFALVVCNPPTHQGKQVIRDVIETAFQNLADNGRLVMVFNRLYSTSYVMEEVFGNFKLIATLGGYKLVESTKTPGRSNQLREEIKTLLTEHNLVPDPLKDQYFLADEDIIKKIVAVANIKPEETVLEIGPGLGQITRELAKKAKKVVAVEIDDRLKPVLQKLPKNVQIIYADARKVSIPFDKMVANVPFSRAQALIHQLQKNKKHRGSILIIPVKSASQIPGAHILFPIPRSSFFPMPKTNAVAIRV